MTYTDTERDTLKQVARQSIEYSLEHGAPHGRYQEIKINAGDYPALLQENRATFVTLNINNDLRGCIGTLEAYQPLVKDIAHNAHAAAFQDPRFSPLQQSEYANLDIHISILSPPEPMTYTSEEDLLQQIRPGIDGLILEDGRQRGTFLPSVWESLKTPEEFLNHLKLKAGLPVNYWSYSIEMSRYTTESF